jgi:hypothetical protein
MAEGRAEMRRYYQRLAAAFTALFEHRFQEFKTILLDAHVSVEFVIREGMEGEGGIGCASSAQQFQNLLLCAVAKGDLEVATFLLDNGADPNARGWDGRDCDGYESILYYIVVHPDIRNAKRMFKLLAKRGADVMAPLDDESGTVWSALDARATRGPDSRALFDSVSSWFRPPAAP